MMDAGRAYRDEDFLKRGEAQIHQLQQQVDELRRLLREQVARQVQLEDAVKQRDPLYLSVREEIDKQSADLSQVVQVRLLEEHRIKQELADLQVRVNEPNKNLRELRSSVTELLETRRRESDQQSLDKHAIERINVQMRDFTSQIGRYDGIIKDLREAIKITANSQEYYQREMERISESIHTVEQASRRQVDEILAEINNLRAEVISYNSRIVRLEDLQRQDSARIDEVPPVLELLKQEDSRIFATLMRVEKQVNERTGLVQDRLEEIRQQVETQFFNINQLITSQVEVDAVKFVSLEDRIRAGDGILQELQLRIEQVRQVSETELFDIYQMEETRMQASVEHVQNELDLIRQRRAKATGVLNNRRPMRPVRRHRPEPSEDYTDNGDNSR